MNDKNATPEQLKTIKQPTESMINNDVLQAVAN